MTKSLHHRKQYKGRDRILKRIEVDANGCWIWQGFIDYHGYGRLGAKTAYRTAYELFVGPVPAGHQLDHLCRVHACVNPEHLEPVTQRENLLRGDTHPAANAVKTHCAHDHPYDEENTYHYKGARQCKTCRRQRNREWSERVSNLVHEARAAA